MLDGELMVIDFFYVNLNKKRCTCRKINRRRDINSTLLPWAEKQNL